jgi:surface antigen
MVFPYLGGYGHVAIVEAVNGDGTVAISEYNWVPYKYSFRAVVNPYNYSAVFIY